ncbi:MAG: carboxypeptidase regulatory-like domain-containing protein [Candidatus Binatia bacterium]
MRKLLGWAICLIAVAALSLSVKVAPSNAGGGTISGKVSFSGDAPPRRKIQMVADPSCAKLNEGGRLGEAVIINDGALQNVFVYLKEGVSGKHEIPKTPVTIDQKRCMYSPRILGTMAGQTLEIINSDATLHNVHSLPKKSRQFNNAMPIKGMKIKKKFTSPEVMVRIKCDVHPWMAAYVGVLDHPYYAVSAADGSFSIADVPAGSYTIEAWHEKFGTKTASVEVSEDGTATANFSFSAE